MKTWEQLSELEQLHTEWSDLYKEANGFRPRWDVSHWTVEDFRKEFETLNRICDENAKEREQAEAKAVVAFEDTISKLIAKGASSREQAIIRLAEAEGATYEGALHDPNYLCYLLGLPYNYLG